MSLRWCCYCTCSLLLFVFQRQRCLQMNAVTRRLSEPGGAARAVGAARNYCQEPHMLTTCTHSDYCLARWLADEGDEVVGVASRGWLMHLAVLERTSPRRGMYVVRYACTRVLSPESLVLAACRHSDVSPPLTLWSNSYIFSSLSHSLSGCMQRNANSTQQAASTTECESWREGKRVRCVGVKMSEALHIACIFN